MKRHAAKIQLGVDQLRRNDPVMRMLIRRCPPLTSLKLESNRFRMLVHSILSQQISVHVARLIQNRLTGLVGPDGLTAERIAAVDMNELREIGISGVKAGYLKDLAEKVSAGEVLLSQIGRRKDNLIIRDLTIVKGIGTWTAQMFLIFSLGRIDVFPSDDHGVRSAIRKLYSLYDFPNKATSQRIAEPWRPYATVATWYLWRSHELKSDTRGKF